MASLLGRSQGLVGAHAAAGQLGRASESGAAASEAMAVGEGTFS